MCCCFDPMPMHRYNTVVLQEPARTSWWPVRPFYSGRDVFDSRSIRPIGVQPVIVADAFRSAVPHYAPAIDPTRVTRDGRVIPGSAGATFRPGIPVRDAGRPDVSREFRAPLGVRR